MENNMCVLISNGIKDFMTEWLRSEDSNSEEAWNAVSHTILDCLESLPHWDTDNLDSYLVEYMEEWLITENSNTLEAWNSIKNTFLDGLSSYST